jgi:putative methionine-R-sulfoxide reductase with GAF domain
MRICPEAANGEKAVISRDVTRSGGFQGRDGGSRAEHVSPKKQSLRLWPMAFIQR